jgi:hypothetical protein
MARKSDYTGDTLGEWFVDRKAAPVDGKRMWHVVNKRTDETAVVPQTQLKALGEGKFFPSSESFLDALEPDVANSADRTAKVLLGNYADDPFSIPDGILPDHDETELAVEFVDPFEAGPEFDDQDPEDTSYEDEVDCCVADPNCVIEDGKHVIDAVSRKDYEAAISGPELTLDMVVQNPWEPVTYTAGPGIQLEEPYGLTKEYREAVAMLAEGYARLRDAISG